MRLTTKLLPALKEKILARDGKLVIRPDSGDPVDIICGKIDHVKEYSLKTCPTEKEFLRFAEDCMHDRLSTDTPHGEHGGDWTDDFIWNNNVYTLNYDPDWNRHDKQFYFIDNFGDKTSTIISKVPYVINPSDKGVIELLWETFGGTVNEKGYKVLDSHIGAIYGDSITLDRAKLIIERLKSKGYTSTNVVFGIGLT